MKFSPTRLICEHLSTPLGIDEPRPRFSWRPPHDQSAFQILVATDPGLLARDQGGVWDTGWVRSNQNVLVEYAGRRLRSRCRYFWKVRTRWDRDTIAPWSEVTWWEMGLLKRSEWQARWIGSGEALPRLRKAFSVSQPVRRARLYATARGLYELTLNGQRVGADVFTPGWTDYDFRYQYQTYDVTGLLGAGPNHLGALLAPGWYAGNLGWKKQHNLWGDTPQLLAQLEVEFADGSTTTLVTDDSWQWTTSPIVEAEFYHGETYDARRDSPDERAWQPVRVFPAPNAKLVASASPCVRKIEELAPQTVAEPTPGTFIFDLGQNMVGWARVRVAGTAGATIQLRFAEVLNPDGTLYTANLRHARCTDRYTLKGQGIEVYEPRFTFHGFRYVEVTGWPGRPTLDDVTGIVLHSDTPLTGTFECSHPMLNQLQHNIVWGQKGNFLEVPTDCPQRDERLGWTGDTQVFCRTAAFNMDVAGFFTKWMTDLADAQSPAGAFPMVVPDVLGKRNGDGGPAWADAGIICPWTIYLCYGDRRILERNYDAMRRYMKYLAGVDRIQRHGFGDWLNIDDPTPRDLIGLAFHAYDAQIMANIASTLGKKRDATAYQSLLQRLRSEFQREFVTVTGRLAGDSQTAYVLALHFDLVPERLRTAAGRRLVQCIHERNDHLATGFVGTPYLLHVLERFGQRDLAYKLLLNEDFPSWGYPIKHGATTMWERWDGWRHDKGFQDPGMNSFNHYAYGAVGEFLYRVVAGLDFDPDAPGGKHVFIRPRPGGNLTWVKAGLESPYGRIESHWRIVKGQFHLDILVPPNASATVLLPGSRHPRQVGSGRHTFAVSRW